MPYRKRRKRICKRAQTLQKKRVQTVPTKTRSKEYRKNRNKVMTPEKKQKGYDTYQNEKGVTCIKNFKKTL